MSTRRHDAPGPHRRGGHRRRDGRPGTLRRLPLRADALRPAAPADPLRGGRRRQRGDGRGRGDTLRLRARTAPTGARCSTPTTSTSSAWSSPTRCTARSSRPCSPPASTCCARSRSPTRLEDAQAMADAAAAHPDLVTGTAFVYRRQPAVAAIRDLVQGELGEVSHFNGRYWCDYARSAADPDGLALQGRPGHRRARRHRQPPHRPRRVRLRADDPGRRRGLHDEGDGALSRRRHDLRPRPRRADRRHGAGRERRRGHLHGPLRLRRGRHLLDLPGRPRPRQLARVRPLRRDTAPPSGTWTGRPSSPSSASCATTGSTATTRCSSARRTPTSRAACRWTSPGSPSASATSSASRPAPSSSRSPASRAACPRSRPSPTACATSPSSTPSSARPPPAARSSTSRPDRACRLAPSAPPPPP